MNIRSRILISFVLGALAPMAVAEVSSSGAGGFKLTIQTRVPVTAQRAYEQFVQVGQWWLASHSYFGASANFTLEERAGGCFCERSGEREVLHMLVTYVDPGRELRMVGGLGPLQKMGLSGGMSWSFEDLDGGQSTITQTYNVSGYLETGLDQLARIVDQVQTQQQQALVAKLSVQ